HRIELPAPLDADSSARFEALGIIQSFQSAAAAPAPAAVTPAASSTVAAQLHAATASADAAPGAAAPATFVAMPTTRVAPISAPAIFRSDWPARPLAPRVTLAAAIAEEPQTPTDTTKPSGTATERAAWLAGAIDAYTARAAYATFDETRKGT